MAAFWTLLKDGVCSISEIGNDRWYRERFWHPRANETGFSYTFAAGTLDDPFAFDAAAFGISPREAEQMDPQQRLLLELVWEALEDAGIPPSSLSGTDVGVFVGASSLDYGSRRMADPASIDAHFMAGNTLSIVANRISYIYGLNGPSFTVDTACSSSLVALNQALLALESGVIDTAIVAGVNILASPMSFVGFSRAGMLSPTGLCRPFSAAADGYVRAEGGVVLVLRTLKAAAELPRAVIVASAVNSDGRTSGLTLPSAEAQRTLLERLYRERDIDPERLAFVEAHGTGTRVGDPAETHAIGHALGQRRSRPLPIGSVKSNIGHLEPASGLAGMLKAMLSLEHRLLPPSLHLDEPNPVIDFGKLNLAPARSAVDLADLPGPLHAGVSSFGFGGTNAHVVLREPLAQERAVVRHGKRRAAPSLLMVSAHSKDALRAAATATGEAILRGGSVAKIAAAAAHRRDTLPYRVAVPLGDPATVADSLANHGRSERVPGVESGKAIERAAAVAFVYSGNGAQWAGMGRAALARNEKFRAEFEAIDQVHSAHADWSLSEMLSAPDLAGKIKLTSIAQPLLFAIQSALTATLAGLGLRPDAVLGHSVGEVAAAEACGALTRAQAVELIHRRSQVQEQSRGMGLMMALRLPPAEAQRFIDENAFEELEIAAINSPNGVTVAGPAAVIAAAERMARTGRISARVLAVDYPFHSRLLAPFEHPFAASMASFSSQRGSIPFLSSVTGTTLDGAALDGHYWWRNIREPVRFSDSVRAAAARGCRVFVEIGPQPILLNSITETVPDVAAVPSFDQNERADGADPVLATLARAVVHGAKVDRDKVFGPPLRQHVELPAYPWQRTRYCVAMSPEATDIWGLKPRHPLIGARLMSDATEWRTTLDPTIVPYLAGHRVDGETVMPAAGFAEMALAAAAEWLGEGSLLLEDFDIVQGLVFADGAMRDVWVRLSGDTQVVEILSRPRHVSDWTLHARGRIGRAVGSDVALEGPGGADIVETAAAEVYARAARMALDYGPSFRRVARTRRNGQVMDVELAPSADDVGAFSRPQVLAPTALDAAFHGLFLVCDDDDNQTYLPVRIGALRVHARGAAVTRAILRVDSHSKRSLAATIALFDAQGAVVAMAEDVRFQAITLGRRGEDVLVRTLPVLISTGHELDMRAAVQRSVADLPVSAEPAEDWLLLVAFARSLAYRTIREIAGLAPVSLSMLADRGTLHHASMPLAIAMLNVLAEAVLASEANGVWTLAPECDLPSPEAILMTICADHPVRSVELAMAARAIDGLPAVLRSGVSIAYHASLIEQFDAESMLLAPGLRAVETIVRDIAGSPGLLRVLVAEPSSLPLIRMLLPLLREGRIAITVAGTDAKRFSSIEARIGRIRGLAFADLGADAGALDAIPSFDLALAFGVSRKLGQAMVRALRPKGALIAIRPLPNPVSDLLLGIAGAGFADDGGQTLDEIGAEAVELANVGPAIALALASPRPAARSATGGKAPVAVFAAGPNALSATLAVALREAGHAVVPLRGLQHRGSDKESWTKEIASWVGHSSAPGDIVHLVGAGNEPAPALGALILRTAAMLDGLRAAKHRPRVWFVTRGAFAASSADDAGAAGAWAFGRVAINEYPEIELRLADLSPELDDDEAANKLAALVAAPGAETELALDGHGLSVIRAMPGLPDTLAPAAGEAAASLHFASARSRDRLEWRPTERMAPQPGEVEIELGAVGLNFRDVMYAAGLLPDDILAEGFAGPALGLEGAGRVVRVGAKVSGLKPGDAVMSFARGAFSSHVTVPADLVLAVPPGVSPEAAATIPVAFLTAWYGLIHLAKLRRNEWVLIHAAAGGVGLAALQIARWRGARIVATAGSEEKRALVRLLGAEVVLDSRSLAFGDQIRKSIGGVDVVLNSLSGPAMEASFKALKPFGRFVELGKRDYVMNSRLGLRPFRRNLTYYGVDIDQLLIHQRTLARKLSRDLARRFQEGAFVSLPYRAFEAEDVHDAFLLMQRSAHIGKIVVRPPRAVPAAKKPAAALAFVARAEGSHLVIGGTSGFGFETARWLAESGAGTIVVASRRGLVAPEVEQAAAELRASGVELIAAHVDITRRDSVEWLIRWIELQHGPLVGVVHAAMTLADGAMAELDETKVASVLATKIDGALHLDRATRDLKLDYFVMYSSATTLIGNPGQASYVAANGFLEGLARRRRAENRPALAVAWGPIADAGVLARDAAISGKLARRTGRLGMKARDALGHLGRLLGRDGTVVDEAAVVCGAVDWSAAARELKVLKTPVFAMLRPDAAASVAESIDVVALLHGKSDTEAREFVTDLVARQVASILRLAAADIDPRRPLAEIGMDSLMGLELKHAIEQRFSIELPLMALTAGKSLADIVSHMIAQLRPAHAGEGAPAGSPDDKLVAVQQGMPLLDQHATGAVSAEGLDRLAEAVEQRRKSMTRFAG